jgi:hypothetical protein
MPFRGLALSVSLVSLVSLVGFGAASTALARLTDADGRFPGSG